jgi:glycerol-3-phosphate dehydrogenase
VRRDLAELASASELDLVVVGGGIHGVAAAWDAAQRGLSVALVERDDFGSGTSWNSMKTIHGGLRHLQRGAVALLRESMRERRALLTVAPALVRPLPFFVPAYGHGLGGREALALGLRANDWLTLDRNRGLPESARIPDGRTVSARRALDMLPGLDGRGLTGAGLYCDAQASSTERLTLGFAHAAAERGARVANHAEAVEVLRGGGRVAGVAVRDALTGATVEVRARLVLNAAGPWADDVLDRAGLRRRPTPLLRARNLVFRRPPPFPYAVGARRGGRFLFLVPWEGATLVGTDYQPAEDPPRDSGDFLAEAEQAFPWAGLRGSRVALVHEGLVPGRGGAAGLAMRARLRDHEAEDGLPGLVSIQGVKLTTARAVAERAVDVVVRRLGRAVAPCRTALTPLPRARPLEGGLEERTRAAVREEMALSLSDAVLRRLDLGTAGPPSAADLDVVCRVLRDELGWDREREGVERAALQRTYPPPSAPAPAAPLLE